MRHSITGQVREDPEWAIARSIQPQERTDGQSAGRISARRHPTGWFITASYPPGRTAEERADFRHFVCVRVYLLLRNGPIPGAWTRDQDEWVAEWLQLERPFGPSAPFEDHDAGVVL